MLLPLFLLTACLINDAVYEQRKAELADNDADGSIAEFDCDDNDAGRFPDADELCNDIDDDCDGKVDDAPLDTTTWFIDGDGDGEGTSAGTVDACTLPSGYSPTGNDCDDTRADVQPGTAEVPYNGIDEDCAAGDLVDVDNDGEAGAQVGGPDCDDTSASVNAGGTEICFDDIDQNCDGTDLFDCDLDGFDSPDAGGADCDDEDPRVFPEASEGWHDLGVDNDCDGRIDDAVEMSLGDADIKIEAPPTGGYMGGSLGTLQDYDGDALRDVWVAANYDSAGGNYSGAIYIISSSSLTASVDSFDLGGDGTKITGANAGDDLGGGVSEGWIDGESAIIVSAPGANGGAGLLYSVPVTELPLSDTLSIDTVGQTLVVGSGGAFMGIYPVANQDINGDGVWDLAVDALGIGPLYIFTAADGQTKNLADADVQIDPAVPGHWLAAARVGDVDDDGFTDLGVYDTSPAVDAVGTVILAGGTTFTSGAFDQTALLRFLGGTGLSPISDDGAGQRLLMTVAFQASIFENPSMFATLDPLADADYQLFRTVEEWSFGAASEYVWLGGAGPSFLLGGPDSLDGSQRGDCVVWQSNEFSSGGFAYDVQLRLVGESAGDNACRSLAIADDYNADGDPDFLIGAPLHDGTNVDSGRVYLQYSP